MTFAEYNHEVLAGTLNIIFGKKVNLWKKGWNFKHPDRYPNDLLYYEILHWACSNNFNHCDFIAFDRSIADALQKGEPLSDAQKKSRHIFNLRFGGVPKILPPARIWIANPLLRFGYENVFVHLVQFRHLPISALFKNSFIFNAMNDFSRIFIINGVRKVNAVNQSLLPNQIPCSQAAANSAAEIFHPAETFINTKISGQSIKNTCEPPEGWSGWPDGKKFALVLTHDVETTKGLDKCYQLAEIEERTWFPIFF